MLFMDYKQLLVAYFQKIQLETPKTLFKTDKLAFMGFSGFDRRLKNIKPNR